MRLQQHLLASDMYFKKNYCSWFSVTCWLLVAEVSVAEPHRVPLPIIAPVSQYALYFSPNKCIALRKGRKCYATIEIKWKARIKNDYCLRRKKDEQLIRCWQARNQGTYHYNFQSSTTEEIELIIKSSGMLVARESIQVIWIYKSRKRKRRWRIF